MSLIKKKKKDLFSFCFSLSKLVVFVFKVLCLEAEFFFFSLTFWVILEEKKKLFFFLCGTSAMDDNVCLWLGWKSWMLWALVFDGFSKKVWNF